MYERNKKISNILSYLPITFPLQAINKTTTKIPHPKIKYIFWGDRFIELIQSLPKEEVCILGGQKQLLSCLINRIDFIPLYKIWEKTLLIEKDESLLNKSIIEISKILEEKKSETTYFIVENDSLPVQRILLSAAKRVNIITIVIQHGMYHSTLSPHTIDGFFSDYFFVINDNQKKLALTCGVPNKKISVMGFHSSPFICNSFSGSRKICFLGQPYSKYSQKESLRYEEIIEVIKNITSSFNQKLYYKPHPWENKKLISKKNTMIFSGSLEESVNEFDIFISLTSTALFEVCRSGKLAIQVLDSKNIIKSDNMSLIYEEIYSIADNEDHIATTIESLINKKTTFNPKKERPLVERFKDSLVITNKKS